MYIYKFLWLKKEKFFYPLVFTFSLAQTMFYMRYNFVLNKHFYNIFFFNIISSLTLHFPTGS